MPDNIDTYGDQAAFWSYREDAWHRLGTVTQDAKTGLEALALGHADYVVEKSPLTATTPGGLVVPVPGKFATTRTNPFHGGTDVLGVVGKRYEIVQNTDNVEFLDEFVKITGAHYETVGVLDEGRKMFVSMKAPRGMTIGGRDAIDLFLVGSNSFDGSSPFRVDATPIRPVCKNTLQLGYTKSLGTFKARHSGDISAKVEEAREAMGVMLDYADEFESMGNVLVAAPMTDNEFKKFVDKVVFPAAKKESDRVREGREKRAAEVFNLWKYAETQDNIRGTKWAAYNAVAEWADWFMPIKDEDARAQRIADDPLLNRIKDKALYALAA